MSDEEPVVREFSMVEHGHLLPAPAGTCSQCAVDHPAGLPHNAHSVFYQYWFRRQRGRWPNWGDALAHCDEETRDMWRSALMGQGVTEDQFVVED